MDSTSSGIFEILKNVNTYPHCFYTNFSRLSLEITMKGTLRVSIAPIIPGMKVTGKVAKGTKCYNDDEKVAFTLNHDDLYLINSNIKAIRTGRYINKNSKVAPEYKNKFSLVHFDENRRPSNFWIAVKDTDIPRNDKGEPIALAEKMVIKIKTADGKEQSFQLTNDYEYTNFSLTHFTNIVSKVAESGIYDLMQFQSLIKIFNSTLYDMNKRSNDGSNNGSNGYNKNYNKPNNNYNSNGNNNNYNNNYNKNNQQASVQIPEPDYAGSTATALGMDSSDINSLFDDDDDLSI